MMMRVSTAERRPGAYPRQSRGGFTSMTTQLTRALNEGRGRTPGNPLCGIPTLFTWSLAAQRRPGAYPRQSRPAIRRSDRVGGSAQRRPGAYPRQSARLRRHGTGTRSTLNEGRGPTPGNPVAPSAHAPAGNVAQRRPGAYPRQSDSSRRIFAGNAVRSTKAGGLPPAIPPHLEERDMAKANAQRRPGAYPRQSPGTYRVCPG